MTAGKPERRPAGQARRTPSARHKPGSRSAARRSAPAYHHGDLRNALLAATESLLNEAGLEGFTLREVARRAGVSHGAPAHHFGDVRGLLSEFTAESFAQMADAMAARRAASAPAAFDQLVSTGVAYVDYALSHRARFQLMFRSDRLDPGNPNLIEAGGRSYGHLLDCITELARENGTPADHLAGPTALAWSIVHGFATLMLENGQFAAQAGGDHRHALAMVEAMLALSRPAFVKRR
jgi:AcrR family transcriptional regulator